MTTALNPASPGVSPLMILASKKMMGMSRYPPIEENAELMNVYQRCAPHYDALFAQRLSIGKEV